MGWAVAVVGRKAWARRQKWRAEVGPRMRGVRPRPLWFRRRSVFWAGIGGEWQHSKPAREHSGQSFEKLGRFDASASARATIFKSAMLRSPLSTSPT